MKRLKHSKLFVIDYSIKTKRETFVIADNMEDALKDHKKKFPNYHRNIKLIQFLSGHPMITDKIAERGFEDIVNEVKPKPKKFEIEEEAKTVMELIEQESK